MIERLGTLFAEKPPAVVPVQGDTNTAVVQAGTTRAPGRARGSRSALLRPAMPEELNRRVIGVLDDLHCATKQGVRNLRREASPKTASC
jgi:UDP-N-acetylglucosamine 2-epimerase (non-hydrolysing)